MAPFHHSLELPLFTTLLVLLNTYLVIIIFTYDTSILKGTFAATTATCFTFIFSFGDSLADTKNLLHYVGDDGSPFAHLLYGKTYFHNATGWYSDGRLIIDFIGAKMGRRVMYSPDSGSALVALGHGREGIALTAPRIEYSLHGIAARATVFGQN